jgi:DNA replication and repair protein RecF
VRLDSLLITGYRNLARVELKLAAGTTILVGDNAQGKSNFLEAIYLLATMKSVHAETDSQVIGTGVADEVLPAARVVGEVSAGDGPVRIEVTIMRRDGSESAVSKTVKVNGVARRVSDAVGRLTAVLFTAEDMEMITGSPSLRRRYLDMTLGQVVPQYSAARPRFERVLTQRNALLKRLREGSATEGELEYWDEELAAHGATIMQARAAAIAWLAPVAGDTHRRLASGEELVVAYMPSLVVDTEADEESIKQAYRGALQATRGRDIAAGMTLTGPHRDDVRFELNGMPAPGFASRAQQRTIALSLRLAEARYLEERRGEPPVILLDDILSEMDSSRRTTVVASIGEAQQVFVTGTDAESFPSEFRRGATLYAVERGSLAPSSAVQPPA